MVRRTGSWKRLLLTPVVLLAAAISAWPGRAAVRALRLKVSENKRSLVSADGRPFFWLGNTAWEPFHRLNREEADRCPKCQILVLCGHTHGGGEIRDFFRLPEGRRLYVCFQNPRKLHPDFDPLLERILAGDPKGTVVLLAGHHRHTVTLLQERFAETIPGNHKRIVFLPTQKFDDYCRLLQLADVVLDPPHYTAGSTAYDIFSFDQPIVTMRGGLAVGRMTSAYYAKMQIDELVAASPDDYRPTAGVVVATCHYLV